uniref:TauD/TfdA-like domain-containing protein n=1 Tax=Arcella intermedia TaxID=1963864 RepID=A0A6B2L8A1_9EUKA
MRECCPSTLHPITSQRSVESSNVSLDVRAEVVGVDEKKSVSIGWSDGHRSVFSEKWLLDHSQKSWFSSLVRERIPKPHLWKNQAQLEKMPQIEYEDNPSKESIRNTLNTIHQYGFARIVHTPPTPEATFSYCHKLCSSQNTLWGSCWDYTIDARNLSSDIPDTAYDNTAIPPHTDCSYLWNSAGIQVFHCLKHEGEGGLNPLVDGFYIADRIRQENPSAYDFLSTYPMEWYHNEKDHKIHTFQPIIRTEDGELKQIRFNDVDRAPPPFDEKRMEEYYRSLKVWVKMINDPENQLVLKLLPGTILMVNNWRVLHARTAYTGIRRMCGLYLDPDSFIDRLRVLSSFFGLVG